MDTLVTRQASAFTPDATKAVLGVRHPEAATATPESSPNAAAASPDT